MTLTILQRRRMAHARYLHQLAVDQAKLPDPQASVSILLLHDAVESFLALAGEHVGVAPREFDKYWTDFQARGIDLPIRAGMSRLNKVRVNLKHYGAHPSLTTIQQLISDAGTFLAEGARLVFNVEYESISMVDLVSQPLPHELAEEAEAAVASGDIVTGMMRLREAFEQLFAAHQPAAYVQRSVFSFGPKLTFPSAAADDLDLEDDFMSIIDVVQPLQIAVRLAVLSIDYTAYLRFDLLTPQNDKPYVHALYHWAAPSGYAPTQEDFDFCMQFVVTASLRLTAAETQASDPPWVVRDAHGRVERDTIRIERTHEHRQAFIAAGRDPREGLDEPVS
ncbi:hypothetical protein [Glycomyces tenuis]|uniref:hypothetical protein n=1 Tax=Glycomyces tenuis TaxID=58116 RepID=UPI0012DC8ACC|nr:hypothetical protein [Glycomyces tenuis]